MPKKTLPKDLPGLETCHDCGAKPGEIHQPGCDVERCSACGGQRLSCCCKGEHDPVYAVWKGIWPGKAEADYLHVDLNQFYQIGYHKIFLVKPKV